MPVPKWNTNAMINMMGGAGPWIASGGRNPALLQNMVNQSNQSFATQQNLNILQKMLADPGNNAQSMTITPQGTTIKLGAPDATGTGGAGANAGAPNQQSNTQQQNPSMASSGPVMNDQTAMQLMSLITGGVGNPTFEALQGLNPSDVYGMSPTQINQAVGFKFQQEQMGRQAVRDYFNNLYRQQDIAERRRGTDLNIVKEMRMQRESDRTGPHGLMNLDVYKAQTEAMKNYMKKNLSRAMAGEEVESFEDYLATQPTSAYRDYKLGEADPGFREYDVQRNKSLGTNITIGQKVDQKKAMAAVEAQIGSTERYMEIRDSDAAFEAARKVRDEARAAGRSMTVGQARGLAAARIYETELKALGKLVGRRLSEDKKSIIITIQEPNKPTTTDYIIPVY